MCKESEFCVYRVWGGDEWGLDFWFRVGFQESCWEGLFWLIQNVVFNFCFFFSLGNVCNFLKSFSVI